MKIVPVRICRDYFGLDIDDETEFADWSIALSALFFSDPTADVATRQLAMVGGDRLIKVIDRSIATIRDRGGKDDKPLARLMALMDQKRLSLPDIHSIMLGMVAGFVPTNVLAGGNCLDVILSRSDAGQAVDEAIAEKQHREARPGDTRGYALQADLDRALALHQARCRHRPGHAPRAPGQGGNCGNAGNAVGHVRSRDRAAAQRL